MTALGEYKKYAQKIRSTTRRYSEKMRTVAITALGGKCIRCGFSDHRALHIDHIHSDGATDRLSTSGAAYSRKVVTSISLKQEKYQLLCANCNSIKRHEVKEKEMPGRPRSVK